MIESLARIRGGHRFGPFDGTPGPRTVKATLPDKLRIPLRQGHGAGVPAAVEIGAELKPGQVIGEDADTVSSPVHASAAGKVEAIETFVTRLGPVETVIVDVSGAGDLQVLKGCGEDLLKGKPEPLSDLLYRAGVGALCDGIPTSGKSTSLEPAKTRALIVHAVHSEPLSLVASDFFEKDFGRLTKAIKALRLALHNPPVYLALDAEDSTSIDKWKEIELDCSDWLTLCPCVRRYPQDHPIMLCRSVLGLKIPDGETAQDQGIVVVDLTALWHVANAVLDGRPVIETPIMLGGSGYLETLTVLAPIGCSVEDLVGERLKSGLPNRLIWDSIMTGEQVTCLESPVDRGTRAVHSIHENRERELLGFLRPGSDRDSFSSTFLSSLFANKPRRLHTNISGEHRVCVACNYCDDACPVDLLPHYLSRLSMCDPEDMEVQDELKEVHLNRCIECGLCSYVCPSKIDLLHDIKKAKAGLAQA